MVLGLSRRALLVLRTMVGLREVLGGWVLWLFTVRLCIGLFQAGRGAFRRLLVPHGFCVGVPLIHSAFR